MASLSPYHQYLFLGKISKTLTPIEEQELETLFAQNKEAVDEYLKLANKLPQEKLTHYINDLQNPNFWRDIPGEMRKEESIIKRSRYIKFATITASAIAIIFVDWFSLNNQKISRNPVVINDTRKIDKKKVQLTLADGKIIDLTSDTGIIKHSDLTITNAANSLTYKNNRRTLTGINSIEVPTGMDYKINLSDGSVVWMNSATKLDFPSSFEENKREISINGEAYLEIAKNSSKPFIVKLPNAIVQVTGTQFNVNTYDSSLTKVAVN